MNGSEIEQSATSAGSVATMDCIAVSDKEEPPGSNYQTSLSYDDLPLFQPSRSTGITDEMVRAAADYLKGKTDKDMRHNKLVRIFQNLGSLISGHKG